MDGKEERRRGGLASGSEARRGATGCWPELAYRLLVNFRHVLVCVAEMRMSKRFSIAGILLSLVVVLPAVPPVSAGGARQPELYRGSRIIGSTVRDAEERKIGVVKDLMLDARRGEIAYAVIRFGGVMGVDAKYHAVPWTALAPGDNGRYYLLRADEDTIERAPGFDKAKWPDMSDPGWSAEVDRYWSRLVGAGTPAQGQLTAPGVSNQSQAGNGR